jgi:hypothetical protein
VVAAPQLKRALWPALAAAAGAALLGLALIGERPATHMAAFEPGGVMRHVAARDIAEVELAAGTRRWRFRRTQAGWESAQAGAPVPRDCNELIETGLKLLHNSSPERLLAGEELAQQSAFGLDQPALTVIASGKERFAISFGGANPIGLARYARIEGRSEVLLLPSYVAETWERLAGLR